MIYISIWELEYVLHPDFFDEIPLSSMKTRDNKMVYYIIEDSVQNSPLAASYVRQAPLNNGFEAYYTLHDGYVFAGSTTATLLLNELSNFRFLPDEMPTDYVYDSKNYLKNYNFYLVMLRLSSLILNVLDT